MNTLPIESVNLAGEAKRIRQISQESVDTDKVGRDVESILNGLVTEAEKGKLSHTISTSVWPRPDKREDGITDAELDMIIRTLRREGFHVDHKPGRLEISW